MATNKEIDEHLKIALQEVGKIQPWYDKNYNAWIFEHPSYPVGCEGSSEAEVITKYPLYLKEFIKERLKNNLAPSVERVTKGKGGYRQGAGRPKGTVKEPTKQIRLPVDIAEWLKTPGLISMLRQIMLTYHQKQV